MPFRLGVYSFGNTPLRPGGSPGSTGEAIRNLIEAIRLAEAVGLDFFGVGEHHTSTGGCRKAWRMVRAGS